MIYWFTGQPGAGKTVLGTKLKDFLQTEKRNWRMKDEMLRFVLLYQQAILEIFFQVGF